MIKTVRYNVMNKDTIKEIVIELRDNQGKSFQDISDYIEQQYGIKKTRQSIHGLYNRAKNKVENNVDNDLMLDIVNLYVLGYNISTIQKLLYSVDNTITNYKITSVINDKSVMIDNIREAFINKVEEQIYNGNTYSNIRENLRYNENVITDNGYRDILKRVYARMINKEAMKIVDKANIFTGDNKLVQELIGMVQKMKE